MTKSILFMIALFMIMPTIQDKKDTAENIVFVGTVQRIASDQ